MKISGPKQFGPEISFLVELTGGNLMLEEFHRVAEGQRGHEVVDGVSGSSLGEVKVGLTMFTENNLKNEWVYSELAQLAI